MWKTVKLGDVAKATGGSGFPKKYQGKTAGHYPFFKVSDMNTEGNEVFMKKAANYVSFEELRRMKAKHHPAGTIVFPKIGGAISTNKKRILTCDAAFDNNVMGVIPKYDISPEYLHKIFLGFNLYELSNKAALPSITNSTVDELEITLPPLPVQKQIVEKLDATFAGIDKAISATEKNIENAEALFSSYLKSELVQFCQKELTIEDISKTIFAGGDAPKNHFSKQKTSECQIPIIANAVKDNGLYGYTNVARVEEHSVTVAARGSGTGHVEIREYPFFPIVRLIVIIPKLEMITPIFLKYALKALTIHSSGSAIPQLTVPMIKSYSIPVPDIEIQQEFTDRLEYFSTQIKKLIFTQKNKLEEFASLKKSILNQAFSGELTKDVA